MSKSIYVIHYDFSSRYDKVNKYQIVLVSKITGAVKEIIETGLKKNQVENRLKFYRRD
jgi:hypothetical protein